MNMSFWDKVKIGFAALFGGTSLIKAVLDWFNEKVLSRISDPDEAKCYSEDVSDFCRLVRGVLERHDRWMSDATRSAWAAVIGAIDTLAKALENCNIDEDELDAVVESVKAAIAAWKVAYRRDQLARKAVTKDMPTSKAEV